MIGGLEPQTAEKRTEFLSMLLWGKPGCGKTELASTLPGPILWMQFDPNGTAALPAHIDRRVFDFSAYKALKMGDFKAGGSIERELLKYVQENGIKSVVFDSMTTFQLMTMQYAVQSGKANVGNFTSTLETPGMTGYGVRTAISVDAAVMLQKVASSTGCHFCIIAHETEKTDDKGKVSEVTTSIAGAASQQIPLRISEVWRVQDPGVGKHRLIYVRNTGLFSPMRSRMFLPDKEAARFEWKYDPLKAETHAGNRISDWYDAWAANMYNKIALPK